MASVKRRGKRDSMGQKLIEFTREMKVVDDKTFQLILKEPYGLVLMSLAKPSSNVPFIMPERIAETPADKQISEYVGSGPFIFKAEEWKPGDKAVFVKSRIHYRAGFLPIARHIIECNGVGVTTSDYNQFKFEKVRRPIYPLDIDARP